MAPRSIQSTYECLVLNFLRSHKATVFQSPVKGDSRYRGALRDILNADFRDQKREPHSFQSAVIRWTLDNTCGFRGYDLPDVSLA